MCAGSIPRSTAVARLDALDSITSPPTYGEAPLTSAVLRAVSSMGSQSSIVLLSRSTTTWALLPRIFRFRSLRKPPITDSVVANAQLETVTARIARMLIAARKPLFFARRCREAIKVW